MEIIKRIMEYAGKYRGKAVLASSLLIFTILVNLIMPYLSRILIDDVIRGGRRELLPWILAGILVAAVCKGLTMFFRSYWFENISQNCLYDLRNDMYRHLQELSFSFYDNHRIGELMTRMTGDLEGIRMFLSMGIPIFLENAIYFTATSIILFSMNVELALVTLAVTPLVGWVAYRFHKKIRPVFGEIRQQNAVLNSVAQENISGVRVVKAFAREDYEIEKFGRENRTNMKKNIKAAHVWGRYFPVMEFLTAFCSVALLWYGGRMVAMNRISLGTVVAFSGYLWMLVMPMRMLGWVINLMEQAVSSGERVFNILDTGSEIKEKENPYSPDEFRGEVEFDDVCFYYKEQQVLFHIDLKVPSGKTIAIMGATGAGKTSIVNLIMRFYDVSSGRVLVDGVDVRDWKLSELRKNIGIVMQETFLFSDTIAENIRYGNPDASMDDIIRAAKIAGAHEFITQMPYGYDTIVGERGMGLSGGQKQRIAIARAIVKDPKILILDDCTSAVDMETEYRIQQALREVMKGRTTFIIAHRISAVKDADEIIVLDRGRIVERGTHYQLLSQRGKYWEIYCQQYKDIDRFGLKRQVM